MGRYLLVVQRLLPGGTETHVLTLAKVLARAGHRVGVFTSGGPWVDKFRSAGVRVHVHSSFLSGSTQRSRTALVRTVTSQQYEVVHAHDSGGFRLLASTPLSARKVITVHGIYAMQRDIRAVNRVAHHIIAVSPTVKSYVTNTCGVAKNRVTLIPNGVSMGTFRPHHDTRLRRELGIPTKAMVIGYAGRFTLGKGRVSRRACQAMVDYAKRHAGVHVVVAGRMSKETLGPRPYPRVHVLGAIHDMSKFYRGCDVVVGTARVALEAMSCEVPTLGLGESRYVGRITPTTLADAYRSNFGDHGNIHSWPSQSLWSDLDYVRHHPHTAKVHAKRVRLVVKRHFSNYRMVSRTLQVYR